MASNAEDIDRIRVEERHPAFRSAEYARIVDAAQNPRALEEGVSYLGVDRESRPRAQTESQELGLRAIDEYERKGGLRSDAADRLDDAVRNHDRLGLGARYLDAVGNPAYNTAFGKLLADPQTGHLRFSPEETAAVRFVNEVMSLRGMTIGTDTAGGFAVPFSLDPTVMLTSNGALNPIRQVARVFTITTDKWKGVSSAGVTASYDAEASEVSDDTPTLAQPVIDCAMGRAFVPFSYELGQDWATLQPELLKLCSDARDVLDATQFLTGTGTDSPAGVITGLSTTQRVQTAGSAAIAIGDIYALKQALPARFMGNATWAMHPTRVDTVFRLTPSGSTTEPQAMPTRDGDLIGRPVVEWTTKATAATTGSKWAIYGDFRSAFFIADRIGMSVELVQNLFGANRRPTAERGLLIYWRTGSKVVVPEALRYGETL